MKVTTVRMSEGLHKATRKLAYEMHISFNALVVDCIRDRFSANALTNDLEKSKRRDHA